MSSDLDWNGCDYDSAEQLQAKIDWEGGLVGFILNYGPGKIPEPLHTAARRLKEAYRETSKVFEQYGLGD